MQEEEQRATADEVDDDERRQRPERVHVVRTREAAGFSQRIPDASALQERRGNREPREGEPGQRRQDEDPDEHANRQEDDDADRESGQERPARRTRLGSQRASADVGQREERSGDDEQRALHLGPVADRELVESRHDDAEHERRKEPAPVEPDRLGHELANRAVGGRELGCSCGHSRTVSSSPASAGLAYLGPLGEALGGATLVTSLGGPSFTTLEQSSCTGVPAIPAPPPLTAAAWRRQSPGG